MRISVGPGTYVLAVSGGVDSMVLLDLLRQRTGVKLIVAHFDHGMRSDSHLDRQLVEEAAKKHNLMFVHDRANLAPSASESTARTARYRFLERVRQASGAKAIITAHHKDDVLETAILNMLRGSGRRGLTSLRSTDGLVRPLLAYDKEHILEYANTHALSWRDDATNFDTRYKRNYVRHNLLPAFTPGHRAQLAILIEELHELNDHLDGHIANLLHTQPARNRIRRNWFTHLPHEVARELVHFWLRQHGAKDVVRPTVERLVIAMKTGRPGKVIDVDKHLKLELSKFYITIVTHTKPHKKVAESVHKKPSK